MPGIYSILRAQVLDLKSRILVEAELFLAELEEKLTDGQLTSIQVS